MALAKYLNYYRDRTTNRYKRIPWDTWVENGSFIGLSPAPISVIEDLEISAGGAVTLHEDFLSDGESDEIRNLIEEETVNGVQGNEFTFLDDYDDVCFMYVSDVCQTFETDYHEPSRNA